MGTQDNEAMLVSKALACAGNHEEGVVLCLVQCFSHQ